MASRRRLILALAGLTALGPIATDLNLPVLPAQAAELGVDVSQAQLTLTAVLLGMSVGQLVAGPVSDRLGRRPVLLAGLVVFALSCLASAFVPNNTALVAVRLVTGLAASATIVSSRAVVADVFPGAEAARAYATLGAVMGIAPATAPLLGGALSRVTGWRGIYGVIFAIGALLVAVAWLAVKETLPPSRRISAHPLSVLRGFRDCLRSRHFVAAMLSLGFSGGVLFTYIASSSFVLQGLHGFTATQFSLDFAVNAFGLFVCANISRRVVRRAGPARLLHVGQGLALIGAAFLLVGALAGLGLVPVLVGFFLAMSSMGFVFSNGTALGMLSAPGGAGAAGGLLGIVGGATGAAVAPLGGLGDPGLSMAVVISVSAVLGPLSYWLLTRSAPTPGLGQPDAAAA